MRIWILVIALAACKGDRTFRMPSSSMLPTIGIGASFKVTTDGKFERGDVIAFKIPCEPEREYVKRAIAIGGDTVEIRCGIVHVNGAAIPATLVKERETYEDAFEDQKRRVEVSRYRETFGGKTYEIFDDVDRPKDPEGKATMRLSKDFPRIGEPPPSCMRNLMPGQAAPKDPQPEGKIVTTGTTDDPCKLQAHFVVPPDAVFTLGDCRNNSNDSRYWGVVPNKYVVGHMK